jgi:hypothetical protein
MADPMSSNAEVVRRLAMELASRSKRPEPRPAPEPVMANQPSGQTPPPVQDPAFLEEFMRPGQTNPEDVQGLREMIGEAHPDVRYEGFMLPTGQAAERWVPKDYEDPSKAGQFTPIGNVMAGLEDSPIKAKLQEMLAGQNPQGLMSMGTGVYVHPDAGGQYEDTLKRGLMKLIGMKNRMGP